MTGCSLPLMWVLSYLNQVLSMNSEALSLTNIIVLVTCVISFALMTNQAGKSYLLFHPVTIKKRNQWYRFFTSGLIHGDVMHLFVNMFVLWSFGNDVERLYYPSFLGPNSAVLFLILYFGGIAVASIPSYLRHSENPSYAALGASGGVAAVVFAIILFAPWDNLYLFGVIPVPQIIAGVGYLYYSWHQDQHAQDNIGHMAHFTGALWGVGFTIFMNFELLGRFITETLSGPTWM
ncbi:MAG: rhomboid family intramembrane serine protease [Gammaproteobacteria bacterium]